MRSILDTITIHGEVFVANSFQVHDKPCILCHASWYCGTYLLLGNLLIYADFQNFLGGNSSCYIFVDRETVDRSIEIK